MRFSLVQSKERAPSRLGRTLALGAFAALVACRPSAHEDRHAEEPTKQVVSALGWCAGGPCCPAGETLSCRSPDSDACSCWTAQGAPSDTPDEQFPRGALSADQLLCISAKEPPGSRPATLVRCAGDSETSVVFDVATGSIRLDDDPGKCLGLDLDASVARDARLVVSECNGSTRQRFFFGSAELRARDICLTTSSARTPELVGSACEGTPSQLFALTPDGEIRDQLDRCLTLDDDRTAHSRDCTGSIRQRWTVAGRGILASRAEPLCLVPPASVGQSPRVIACEAATRRDLGFTIRGDLRIATPDDTAVKCLAAAALEERAPIHLKSCVANNLQRWRWTGSLRVTDLPWFMDSALELALADRAGFARKTDGSVWAWGYNDHGELGPSSAIKVPSSPAPVQGLDHVRQIVAGARHACALVRQSVVCWGGNDSLQLDGSRRDSMQLVSYRDRLDDVVRLAAGATFTCALKKTGAVVCWGTLRFANGEDYKFSGIERVLIPPLLHGFVTFEPIQIAAGSNHLCALDAKGVVKCIGSNTWGAIADKEIHSKNMAPRTVPLPAPASRIDAGGDATCATLVDGQRLCWGSNGRGSFATGSPQRMHLFAPSPMPSLAGFTSLALGEGHSCGKTVGRQLQCWGNNTHGELGDGTEISRTLSAPITAVTDVLAVAVSREQAPFWTCASRFDGTVSCWGGDAAELVPSPTRLKFSPTVVH